MFPKIFSGIQIADFSRLLPGPFASSLLQKMGAKVSCILPPQADPLLGAYSPFKKIEAGKEFSTLDLKTEVGIKQAKQIISQSSILLEGFRPGTMARLGLGFEDVKKLHPDILYVSIVGYSDAHHKYLSGAHDINFLVDSGLYSLLYSDQSMEIPALQFADVMGGFYAVFQILMAWIQRAQKLQARHIKVSVVEGLKLLSDYLLHESSFPLLPMLTGGLARYRIYKTKDSKRVAVASLEPKFYENFLKTLKISSKEGEAEDALIARIQDEFNKKSLVEWKKVFENVDACLSFIPSREEVLREI
jgi:crotonobetainyl-CoA:carnitine CoA-transferase CaiB-like acyl-CoA transferase